MKSAIQPRIKRHTATFSYAGSVIPFHFWSHTHEEHAPDTVIFLGTGQTGRLPKWVAQAAPAGVVVVEGAPHWHSHPSANDLYEFMYSYTETAFLAVLTEFGLPAAHVVAQSQAAPGVVKLGISHTASVRNVVLYAPLGFAATTFGNTSEERLQTLARRARQSLMQRSQLPIYDPRNLYAGFAILRAITREVERGASKRKYAKGLSYDMREDCKTLVKKLKAQGTTVTLLLGDQDKIFTVDDIQPALKEAGITDMHIHVLPDISHLSLAVRAGKRVLQVATDIARAAKASR